MPLNPNGKIDKPALPFPDTAQASHVATAPQAANPTEKQMQSILANILPNAPAPIPLDESFFDLGGHSILATRLIFEIRKVFVVNAPLGLIFEQPTIAGLVSAVESLRNADLGLAYQAPPSAEPGVEAPGKAAAVAPLEYGQDYIDLLQKLKPSYHSISSDFYNLSITVFLTGATGFLGAFILKDLLSREERVKKVICLIRGSDQEKALTRLRESSTDRGVWNEKWVQDGRLEVVVGDLGLDQFGLDQQTWNNVASEADVVLHNGALVSTKYNFAPSISQMCDLGTLGISVRSIEGPERACNAHCNGFSLNWKAQSIYLR